jgi:hypothetical protein
MLQEDATEELDRSSHDLITRREIRNTLSYLKSFTDCCFKWFSTDIGFDRRFPEANCRDPKEEDAKKLLVHISYYDLKRQWDFILENTRSYWFSGLFHYLGDGYRVVNRLLTGRCIELVRSEFTFSEKNHCVGDNLREAVHTIQMLYRCYETGMPSYPISEFGYVYSSFLSTTLSLKFAQNHCDLDNIVKTVQEIIYIEIPPGSKVCPIINRKKINYTLERFTEFEILLDRKGTLVEMTPQQKRIIKDKIGQVAYDTLSGFYIYNSYQLEEMGFYTLPEDILPYLARGKTRRKRKRKRKTKLRLKSF